MVIIGRSQEIEARLYDDGENVRNAEKRILVGPKEDAPNFSMRKFTIQLGGHTPYHTHPWEHEVYVLSGSGVVKHADGFEKLGPGDFAFVPPNDEHQFRNVGAEPFEFLCVVPLEGEDG